MRTALLAFVAGAGAATPVVAEAAALCGGPPPVAAVAFPAGSAALPAGAGAAQERAIRDAIGGSELAGYQVLAMGDLGEGAAWEQASVEARRADQALARARGMEVVRLLRRAPHALRANVSARLLPYRPAALREGLAIDQGTGAVIVIGVRFRDANGVYIAC